MLIGCTNGSVGLAVEHRVEISELQRKRVPRMWFCGVRVVGGALTSPTCIDDAASCTQMPCIIATHAWCLTSEAGRQCVLDQDVCVQIAKLVGETTCRLEGP